MKKLFMLTPLMLLTSMIHCADISSITVTISTGSCFREQLKFNVNLHKETFQDLANKVYNTDLMQNKYNGFTIKEFGWLEGGHAPDDQSTLSEAGVHNGETLYAELRRERRAY